jgi:hypothetical protein
MITKKHPFKPEVEVAEYEDGGEWRPWEGSGYFVLSWVARGWGFGLTTFRKLETGGLYCGNEGMRSTTIRKILDTFCACTPESQWPVLLRSYGNTSAVGAAVMADVVEWEGGH